MSYLTIKLEEVRRQKNTRHSFLEANIPVSHQDLTNREENIIASRTIILTRPVHLPQDCDSNCRESKGFYVSFIPEQNWPA